MGLTVLVETAKAHSEKADEALKAGLMEEAQSEMALLAEAYGRYMNGLTEESPEQQDDDADKEAENEPKPNVNKVPSGSHCVPS